MVLYAFIRRAIRTITNPSNTFSKLGDLTFEDVLGDYLKVLILAGILSSVTNMVIASGNALFLDVFRSIDISYVRMLNYSAGRSAATVFLYLFAGTFVVFILSAASFPFFRSLKFTEYLKIVLSAMTPLLLFSWIIPAIPGLVIWTVVLYWHGIRIRLGKRVSVAGTIRERD